MPPEERQELDESLTSGVEDESRINDLADSAPADDGDVSASDSSTDTLSGETDSGDGEQTPQDIEREFREAVTKAAEGDADSEDTDPENKPKADSEEKADADKDDAKADKKDADDEQDDENLPFGKHPRWKQVLSQRDEARAQAEQLERPARQFEQIQQFMQSSDLTPQEVSDGFQVMALMKSDPAAARERLAEYLRSMDEFVGNVLPDDLQDAVDEGRITEDYAKQLVRSRNESAFERERAGNVVRQSQEQLQLAQQREQQQQVQQIAQQQQNAVRSWEQDLAKRDPDYPQLQQWVAKELKLALLNGRPQTSDEAVQMAQKAYDDVKASMQNLLPRRQTSRGPRSADTRAGTGAQPQPQTLQEAVFAAASMPTRN